MNVDNYNPSIVIVNNIGTIPVTLLNLITKNSDVKENSIDRLLQLWQIDNKYYTADVDVHGITQHFQRDDDFNENIKALIIHIDPSDPTCLADLDKWKAIEHDCEPEIKLLVSDNRVDETKISLTKITDWCLKRGYEFIVLNHDEEIDQDEIIKEKFGIDRIVEVLQTYIWPNLDMKESKQIYNTSNELESKPDEVCGEQSNSDILNELTSDGMDNFTELFGQLHMMKQNIQSMPLNERKLYAEQMVTAFWRAIGGDEEEIEDL